MVKMNRTSFLDYYKIILEKVSFDQQLLAKEYRKALEVLSEHEVKDLDRWLRGKSFADSLHVWLAKEPGERPEKRVYTGEGYFPDAYRWAQWDKRQP